MLVEVVHSIEEFIGKVEKIAKELKATPGRYEVLA